MLEQQNIVLCHTHLSDTGRLENGYRFLRESSKAQGAGVWVWGEKKGKKIRVQEVEAKHYFLYPDRDGKALIRVARQKGGKPEFWQEYFINGQWITAGKVPNELKAEMRSRVPIYRYAEVQDAINRGELVVWAEGEKCCDALWSIGVPATTSIGGSGALSDWGDYSKDLDGADLAIAPDRDEKGIEYASKVRKLFPDAKTLKAYPKSLVWSYLPENGGLDVADWIKDGATKEMILAAIDAGAPSGVKSMPAVALNPDADPDYDRYRRAISSALAKTDPCERDFLLRKVSSAFSVPFTLVQGVVDTVTAREGKKQETSFTLRKLLNEPDIALDWVIPGFLPMAETVLLTAKPKVGKTLLAYEAARAVATGGKFLNETAKRGRVLIIQCEEGRFTLRSRMQAFDMDELDDLDSIRFETQFDVTRDLPKLESILEDFRPQLVIIDSVRKINARSRVEENSAEFSKPIYAISDLLRDYNAAGILIHHDRKSQGDKETIGTDNVAGHSSLVGATWGSWRLLRTSANEDDPNRQLSISVRGTLGSRHALALEEGAGLTFKWDYQGEVGFDPKDKEWQTRIIEALKFNHGRGKTAMTIHDLRDYFGLPADSKVLNKPLNRAIERQLISCQKDPSNKRIRLYSLPDSGKPTPPPPFKDTKISPKSTQTHTGSGFPIVDSIGDSKIYSAPLTDSDISEIVTGIGFPIVDSNSGQILSEEANLSLEILKVAIAAYLALGESESVLDWMDAARDDSPELKKEVWLALPSTAKEILKNLKNGRQETQNQPVHYDLSTIGNPLPVTVSSDSSTDFYTLEEGGGTSPFTEVNGIVEYSKKAKPRGKSLPVELSKTEESGFKVGDRVNWVSAPEQFAFARRGVQIVKVGNGCALLEGVTSGVVAIADLSKDEQKPLFIPAQGELVRFFLAGWKKGVVVAMPTHSDRRFKVRSQYELGVEQVESLVPAASLRPLDKSAWTRFRCDHA